MAKRRKKVVKAKKTARKGKSRSELPLWIKVISIMYYISAAMGLLVGITLLISSDALGKLTEYYTAASQISGTALSLLILGTGVLEFFVGRGLWKKQKWARMVAIIIAILGSIGAVISIVQQGNGTFRLIIHAVIGSYLIFSRQVKAKFS